VIDEIALYVATLGTRDQGEEFQILLRDVVARGRAVGIPVVGATQRPSADIITTSLRTSSGTGARSGAPPRILIGRRRGGRSQTRSSGS
jgi:hypothetical protein